MHSIVSQFAGEGKETSPGPRGHLALDPLWNPWSFRRKRESNRRAIRSFPAANWIPAFAGMTSIRSLSVLGKGSLTIPSVA